MVEVPGRRIGKTALIAALATIAMAETPSEHPSLYGFSRLTEDRDQKELTTIKDFEAVQKAEAKRVAKNTKRRKNYV